MKKQVLATALLFSIFVLGVRSYSFGDEEFTADERRYDYRLPDLTVIGSPTRYKVIPRDNILDIARRHGLGFNEMELLYPRTDAWVLPTGKDILVPTFWVLPPTQHQQLVINVPELRLYLFDKNTSTVQTFPIGIGDEGWETPLGIFSIVQKRSNPTWYLPLSLQGKYGIATMPPGPENPLGEFIMKFSAGAYGIHGTAMPWGVGRLVSHGCIRCYPEHIRVLYPQVLMGTRLEVIYEPLKFGRRDRQIFVEAHPDVYNTVGNYAQYAKERLDRCPYKDQVDQERFLMTISLHNGVPTNVTRFY